VNHHLAQVNIALPRAPRDSPLLEDFIAELDPVNALADAAPGFVWRLQTEDGDATAIRAFGDDRLIVNMSVWESPDALADYTYGGRHLEVLRRRREWFHQLAEVHTVLWWVPVGHIPSIAEAEQRLALLREHGPTPQAFTLQRRFPPPDAAPDDPDAASPDAEVGDDRRCPA
jgi:hypothetical protein